MNDESDDGYRFRYARWCGMLGAEVMQCSKQFVGAWMT